MELRVFNRNIEFLGILRNVNVFRRKRKYSEAAEYELKCMLNENNRELLKEDNIIIDWQEDKEEFEGCEIKTIAADIDSKGKLLSVKGFGLSIYLKRRIIEGTENINTDVFSAVFNLVDKNCINPANSLRKVNKLVLGNKPINGEKLQMQISNKNLYDTVCSISKTYEIGFDILINPFTKQFIFKVYKGLDRSIEQSENDRAVFDVAFDNVEEEHYERDKENYRNMVYIAGEGIGAGRTVLTINNTASGLDRHELFVDARDLQSEIGEETLTEEQYNNVLIERGKAKLSDYKLTESFDGKIKLNGTLEYGVDYNLGDIVTRQSEDIGVLVNTRITEIEEVYEGDKITIAPTFGYGAPDLIKKIKARYE